MSERRTAGQLLRAVGRGVLWLAVAVVLLRGLASIFGGDADADARRPTDAASASSFPDAEAQAFAVSFARAYLTFAPGRQEWVAPSLGPYLAPRLREDAGLEVPESGPAQIVEQATVARTKSLGSRRGLVTVATTVSSDVVTTRYLTVPVARDEFGGLAVQDYPSFSPPPARANVEDAAVQPLPAAEQRRIEALLERFFPVYFAGPARQLDYFLSPGTRLRALPEHYSFLGLDSVEQASGGRSARRVVIAAAEVRDRRTGASFALSYRIALERRDRWYVTGLNDS